MSLPDGTASPTPPRSRRQRNWKWGVPAGCLTIVALVAVLGGAIVLFVFTMFRHTDVFREAIARAEANPQVRAELGEPIHEGWWVMGQVRITGPSGRAALSIPLKGSRKDGTVYAVAHKSAGIWKYDTLEVAVEGRPGRISLLVGEGPW
jgi:Cytochrome oxidase complex assembly protein 1